MRKNDDHIAQELFEAIDRYVAGEMNEEELALFEARIRNDKALATKVEEQRELILAVEESSLREEFNTIHAKFFDGGKRSNRKALFSLSAGTWLRAASVLLVIAVGSYFLLFQKDLNERLYEAYFKPDPGLATVMSGSSDFAFYDAMVDYKQGNYEKAIQKWDQQTISKPGNDTLNYFLGVAWLADDNPEKAVPFLESTVKNNNSVFIEDANYYLGMAFLRLGNIEKARTYFVRNGSEKSREVIHEIDTKLK